MKKGLICIFYLCTFLLGCTSQEGNDQPKMLATAYPTYPYHAMALRQEGFVEVKYDVGRDGKVSNIRITKSKPHRLFDSSVISAMSKWQYEQDKPSQGMTKRIHFKLTKNCDERALTCVPGEVKNHSIR